MSLRGLALLLVVAESSALRVPTRLVPPLRARPAVCLAGEPDEATLERGRAALEKMRQSAGVGFAAEPEAPSAVEPARAPEPTSGPAGAAPEPILFKEDPCDELAFPRLRVKHRSLVPSGELLGGGASGRVASLQERGRDVSRAHRPLYERE